MAGLEYREVIQRLKVHDSRFEIHQRRGKGSHHMIFHPDIGGGPRHIPVPYHGDKTLIKPGLLNSIRRMFNLPDDFFRNH